MPKCLQCSKEISYIFTIWKVRHEKPYLYPTDPKTGLLHECHPHDTSNLKWSDIKITPERVNTKKLLSLQKKLRKRKKS